MDITIELPPGDTLPLDCALFRRLVHNAMQRTLDDLREVDVPQRLRMIFRGAATIMNGYYETSNDYLAEPVWRRLGDVWHSPEAVALTDYLWSRGAMKSTLTGPDPGKDEWARWTHHMLVFSPLIIALDRTMIEALVDAHPAPQWAVAPTVLEQIIDGVVAQYCQRRPTVRAVCPLSRLALPEGVTAIPIADDIALELWSPAQRGAFLSRLHREFVWDDFKSPMFQEVIAVIAIHADLGHPEDITATAASGLDLLKWALFLASRRDVPVSEGVCLLEGPLEDRHGTLRRDSNMGTMVTVDSTLAEEGTDLVRTFREASAHAQGLDQALWHFGRACVAALPRDIVLESAVGLDSLLVPGVGDSRYRFCLHGAALLAAAGDQRDGQILYRALDEVYNERGRAAHGDRPTEAVDATGRSARKMLAESILAAARLILSGDIDPQEGVAIGVQRFVLRRATSA